MRVALCGFALLAAAASAQDVLSQPAFEHFYNLEYDEAIAIFSADARNRPAEPGPLNHIAQCLLYRAMYRAGALESGMFAGSNPFTSRPKVAMSPEDDQQFTGAIARAMELADARIKANPNDARALYSLGASQGLRSNYSFLVKHAYRDTLRDASAARKLHHRVTELDASLVDARLVQGVYDYVVGSLPLTMRMLGFIAGFHGDRERGIQTLKTVAAEGKENRYDAAVLLCALLRREKRPREAVPLLGELIQKLPRNFLMRFELAEMYTDLRDKPRALEAIGEIERLKHSNAVGYGRLAEEKIRFARGNLLFTFKDFDPALEDLKAATANATVLDKVTGAEAWLRLGQVYDLKGQRQPAINAYQQVLRTLPESEAGSLAKRYSASRYRL